MQNKKLILVFFVTVFLIFLPVPTDNFQNSQCSDTNNCPSKGWYLKPSLFNAMKLLSEGKGASENSYQINTKLWNTYRDNEYGFYQFKYPEDWYSFSRLGFNRISSASIDDFTSIKLLQGNAILNSQTLYKNKEVSLEEWIGQKPFNEKDVDVISKSTIKVAKKNSPNFKYSYKNE